MPSLGYIWADRSWSSVVFPAPLGPMTTQRCASPITRLTSSRRVAPPRLIVTPASSATAAMPPNLPDAASG